MSGKLGDLSAAQSDALVNLRQLVSEHSADNVVTQDADVDLLRFLRARSFSVDAAFKQWAACQQWRKENNVDGILEGPFPLAEDLKGTLSCLYHGVDKDHQPLYLERSGAVDAAVVARLNPDDLIRRHIYHQELQVRRVTESSVQYNDPTLDCWCEIHDMRGLSMQHRQVLGLFTRLARLDTDFYPERAGRIFFVNVPTIFPALWKICRRALDAKTREKFVVLSNSQLRQLLDYFDADQLPVEYGGTAEGLLPPLSNSHDEVLPLADVKLRQLRIFPRRLCLRVCGCGDDEVVTWYFRMTSKSAKFSVRWNDDPGAVFDGEDPVKVRQWLENSAVVCEPTVVAAMNGGVKDSYFCNKSGVLGIMWENDSLFQSRDLLFQLSVDKQRTYVLNDDVHTQSIADASDQSLSPRHKTSIVQDSNGTVDASDAVS